jgi:hypothetical protein
MPCARLTAHAQVTTCPAQVVLANPKTAGVARWIFLALWGSQRRAAQGGSRVWPPWRMLTGAGRRRGGQKRLPVDDEAAAAYVNAVFANVVVQPRDAREASDVFYKQKVPRGARSLGEGFGHAFVKQEGGEIRVVWSRSMPPQ